MAARAAERMGATVLIIDNTHHVGGIFTSGLGSTDSYYHSTIGGLPLRFFKDVAAHYGGTPGKPQWFFEPHVAESIFNGYLGAKGITVLLGRTVSSVTKSGASITAMTLDNGTVVHGTQWIDASYEGDLMAESGASYKIGRESSAQYSESYAGWGGQQQTANVNPFLSDGSLIPGVLPDPEETKGQADGNIMAYSFRSCITSNLSNAVPFPKPSGYDPNMFLGTQLYIQNNKLTQATDVIQLQATVNNKFDLLSQNFFSADYPNASLDYPDGDWDTRTSILSNHYTYVAGLLYFLANETTVPASIRTQMNQYGLAADEFTDNNNWPWQMYVREGRRLQGQYIMTQADLVPAAKKTDKVGVGLWSIDSHGCALVASTQNGKPVVLQDGSMYIPEYKPYDLPFRSILPKQEEVTNLAVTCCVSSSHIGFSSLRVEPTFMVLGEAAGTAAGLAMEENVPLSEVTLSKLQSTLVDDGVVMHDNYHNHDVGRLR